MRILGSIYNINLHQNTNNQNSKYPNLKPLACDTVSFSAMKKKEFDGFDRAVIEKYKAPINQFHTHVDFNTWASTKAKEISQQDYRGRHHATSVQRETTLNDWAKYIFEENDAYTPAMQLIIMDSITKKLNRDNDNVPPLLNKGVLADCMDELGKTLKEDPKAGFDFNKIYNAKLNAFYLDDKKENTGEIGTKWIVIPSLREDPDNFEANVEKLKTLSYKSWCTKSLNAEHYLRQGAFHIYLEEGKPKIGIRIAFNRIEEIQGEKNNGEVPYNYYDVVNEYIQGNTIKLSSKATQEMENARRTKIILEDIKDNLSESIKRNDAENIFNFFGIKTKKTPEGKLIISEYHQPKESFTFNDIGINEDELLKDVVAIDGNANFEDSNATKLENVEIIRGNATFTNSKIKSLGKLKSILSYANFENSQVSDLGELETICGSAYCSKSQITHLANLKKIGGNAIFNDSNICDLGELKLIEGEAFFANSKVTRLGKLEYIGGNAHFSKSEITHLDNLKVIGGNAYFEKSKVCDLGALERICLYASYENSPLTDADFKNISIAEYVK